MAPKNKRMLFMVVIIIEQAKAFYHRVLLTLCVIVVKLA